MRIAGYGDVVDAHEAVRRLGLTSHKTVGRWVALGYLEPIPERGPRGKRYYRWADVVEAEHQAHRNAAESPRRAVAARGRITPPMTEEPRMSLPPVPESSYPSDAQPLETVYADGVFDGLPGKVVPLLLVSTDGRRARIGDATIDEIGVDISGRLVVTFTVVGADEDPCPHRDRVRVVSEAVDVSDTHDDSPSRRITAIRAECRECRTVWPAPFDAPWIDEANR